MKKYDNIQDRLELLEEVYDVSQLAVFVFLDLLLLSFFFGFLLYAQLQYWSIPALFGLSLFLLSSAVFQIFIREKKQHNPLDPKETEL
ncbi:MAG: hypothetical protein ACI4XL_06115 [Bacillus sp. (in: firmicutes)]